MSNSMDTVDVVRIYGDLHAMRQSLLKCGGTGVRAPGVPRKVWKRYKSLMKAVGEWLSERAADEPLRLKNP